MSKQVTKLAAGWVQDRTTLLYHYYREEAGMAAHKPLCEGPVLLTAALRRHAGDAPEGLKPRYLHKLNSKREGICQSCWNRHANLKK